MTRIKDYQPKQFTYNDPKKTSNTSKQVYINYNDEKKPFELSTPTMYLPWQVKGYPNANGEITKYDLTLSFGKMDENPRTKMMHDKLIEFDNKILKDACSSEYSFQWFGVKKPKKRDVVDDTFKKQVKYAVNRDTGERDDKYPPTFKAKLAMWDGKYKFDMFDKEGNKLLINEDDRDHSGQILYDPIKLLSAGARMKCLVQSSGLWFAGGNFGHGWKVKQIMFISDIVTTSKKCAIEVDSDDDGDDDIQNQSDIDASDSDVE